MTASMNSHKMDVAADLYAERSVLGILLRNSDQIDFVNNLRAEHFLLPGHRAIFESIERLSLRGARSIAEPISVYDDLCKHGHAEEIDGRKYLFELQNKAGAEQSLEAHAAIVQERALSRSVRLAAGRANDIAINSCGLPAAAVLEKATNEFTKLSDDYCRKEPVSILEVCKEYVDKMDRLAHGEAIEPALSTGIPEIDKALCGGLKPGKLYIVGARPSMGKSALALNWAAHQSTSGSSVAFFSLEMPREELMERLCGIWGRQNVASIDPKDKRAVEEFFRNLTPVAIKAQEARLFVDDDPDQALIDVVHKARLIKRKHGLDALYIDYVQLMSGPEVKRHEMIGAITRGLKRLAKSLEIPVVALSQLSRKVEDRPDRRPLLADLRESGDIEQDADVVIMPYREAMDRDNSAYPDLCEVFIRKQRGGPKGQVDLRYEGQYMSFSAYTGMSASERARKTSDKPKRGSGFY